MALADDGVAGLLAAGGPYEYGVPDAVHGIFKPPEVARPKQPAGTQAAAEESSRE